MHHTLFRALLAALLLLAAPAALLAQTAPAGNAHPETQAISTDAAMLPNPFGEPDFARATPAERKRALADAVDLRPLEGLAVFHNGRVKVLDTLARETVQRIAGRRSYIEFAPGESGAVKRRAYDPLFTFLDLVIDPVYYADKPLIHVEYLPLRRAFVEAAFPEDQREQERWLRATRLSPRIILGFAGQLQAMHEFEQPYRIAFSRIGRALELYELSPANLLMLAPPSPDQPYSHLSTLPADSPIRHAAMDLGRAWRAGDAAAVNSAAIVLADLLPRVNREHYPTFHRSLELAYNRANAFEWGAWGYCLSLVALILAFGTGRRWLVGVGIAALALAVVMHSFGFISRCLIAERFAIQNQFESMTGLSLFAAILGLGIMIVRRRWLFGAAAAGVGFLVLLAATQTAVPGRVIEREAAILNTSVLLKYHVTTVLVSYGLISLGFIVSLFYLGAHYARRFGFSGGPPLRGGDSGDAPASARTLADLDTAQLTVLQLAFWTLGVGILLGAWWADHSWGRWWNFDPKETWALATWIIYLIVIHLRFTMTRNRALATAWLSILGFLVMLWTYFGVNLLLPGLHAYA